MNYLDFYHFLEGLCFYERWQDLIDKKSKHKKIKNGKNDWCDKNKIHNAFEQLFEKFQDSVLVVSYRSDGTPSIMELVSMLKRLKNKVEVNKLPYKYALSKNKVKRY